ncbi:copper/zinc superoxide dismutase [Ancylostoma duodenale]|uniref:Copper/zinc superoxide dismutase n=1 Tax=Ancylostoma duodenale TaxID=51022 RepID=A0A0C2D9P2_9BILA|nr:copper/zinc superoxide dismutase [Ancylostoma duodenale]
MSSSIVLICAIISSSTIYQPLAEVTSADVEIFKAEPGENPTKSLGKLHLTQTGSLVTIRGTIAGLSKGAHGFNIHEEGKLGDSCSAAGARFNPNINLGDIRTSVTGATMVRVTSREISLKDIAGRSIVIYGNSADEGTRIACGVIHAF